MAWVERSKQVEPDLIEIYFYIAQDSPASAERVLEAAERLFKALAEMPGMGRRWESRFPHPAETRSIRIPGFRNYLVFYRPIDGGIRVLRVLHGARDLGPLLDQIDEESP